MEKFIKSGAGHGGGGTRGSCSQNSVLSVKYEAKSSAETEELRKAGISHGGDQEAGVQEKPSSM